MIKYNPKYEWPKINYINQIGQNPTIYYTTEYINVNLDDAELGGSFFNNNANWFNIRQNLCEKNIFLYDIQTKEINVFNGILIKPIVNNLNIYTDRNDYNIIYLTRKTQHGNIKVCVKIIFEKDFIRIIEILTDSTCMQTD